MGCPAVPATPAPAGQPPALAEGPAVTTSLPFTAFDRVRGPDGEVWVVLASDRADVCATIQHQADAKASLGRATVALVPVAAGGGHVGLGTHLAKRATHKEAARRLRTALSTGRVGGRGLAVDIVEGHPSSVRDLVALPAGGGGRVLPCPGLVAYLRTWIESSAAGRPPPAPKKRRAKAPADAAPKAGP